ncbi:MAG: hypothetical protein KDB33_16995 [Acidimicrobiales bacterium]|nr:hypothetical protein [Acidimicrobiales bacterium]MCB1262062.1 hypothetical protein [Acidimicrobiales bacterium]
MFLTPPQVCAMLAAMLRDAYDGPFDPDCTLADFSRAALATIGREYLMHGHMQDRVGIPSVLSGHGLDGARDVSIDEWMAASPIYSGRTQRLLHFAPEEGPGTGTVETIFKNLQFDVGAPHQFMDFRYALHSPTSGEFWLDHCGALMDAEPMGEVFVQLMCHDIEDPTFDATAAAANRHAQIRPIHRPPRVPADRSPHCHWTVTIDPANEAYGRHHLQDLVEHARIADVALVDPGTSAEPGGWDDYAGPFDPDLQLEDFSQRALVLLCQEAPVQSHLLARAFMLSIHERFGLDDAVAAGTTQCAGVAGLTAQRLAAALGVDGTDADAVAKVFQLHPLFLPRTYVDLRVERTGDTATDGTVRVAIGPCPAFEEGDDFSWFAPMRSGAVHPAVVTIARAVHAEASVSAAAPQGDEVVAWEVAVPVAAPSGDAPAEDGAVALAKISTGATHVFIRRRPVRV